MPLTQALTRGAEIKILEPKTKVQWATGPYKFRGVYIKMIKTLSAFTYEIDEPEIAVAEILGQLDMDNNLRKNSLGIISCFSEYIESGVVETLCKHLPFPVAGITTLGNSTLGEATDMLLAISVLTSDDVSFVASATRPLTAEDLNDAVKEAYSDAIEKCPEAPAMAFAYLPLMNHLGGDIILIALNDATGGIPIFGPTAVDHNVGSGTYSTAQPILNGEGFKDSLVFVLVCGDVQPTFLIASVSSERVNKQKAIITDSEGTIVKKINDKPVIEYMGDLGLAKDGTISGLNAIPFVIDYNDNTTRITRSVFAITPEGYAVCGGDMPLHGTLSIASLEFDDIINTSKTIAKEALKINGKSFVLMYACVARNLVLGADTLAEMEAVKAELSEKIPFQFSYAGGESCPVFTPDGKSVNRYHNCTLIACVL